MQKTSVTASRDESVQEDGGCAKRCRPARSNKTVRMDYTQVVPSSTGLSASRALASLGPLNALEQERIKGCPAAKFNRYVVPNEALVQHTTGWPRQSMTRGLDRYRTKGHARHGGRRW